MNEEQGSVTRFIYGFRQGDVHAFEQLWERYFKALQSINRDEKTRGMDLSRDDIVQEVMVKLYKDLPSNDHISNRHQLWSYLTKVARGKWIDEIRRKNAKKRGEGKVVHEGQMKFSNSEGKEVGLAEMVSDDEIGPAVKALARDNYFCMMSILDADEQKIAEMELEGLTIQEIANKIGISSRSVDRKLKNIRDTWAEFLAKQED